MFQKFTWTKDDNEHLNAHPAMENSRGEDGPIVTAVGFRPDSEFIILVLTEALVSEEDL